MDGEHAAEMMSPAAGLHPDNTRRKLLRQSDQRLPSNLTPHHDRTGPVEPDHAADFLAKIDAKNRDCRQNDFQLLLLNRRRPYDTGRRADHPIKRFPRALKAHLDGLPETTPVEIWFEML